MGLEMVTESWFGGFWKGASENDKALLGILTFEAAGLMSKVVSLWNSVSNSEIIRLREEIMHSIGIQRLVSDADDDEYTMNLALNEIIEIFGNLARSVVRIGKRCTDPIYHRFEYFLKDPIKYNLEWFAWAYRWNKMERRVKKLERFVAVTMQLTQELEVLAELEQTLRRLQRNESDKLKVLEFQQKVMWQRQEVRTLREMSPWVRTYDYIVRLLVRSLLTILERIKLAFGVKRLKSGRKNDDCELISIEFSGSRSFSGLMQASVYPSDDNQCGFSSGHLGRSVLKSCLISEKNKRSKKDQNNQHHTGYLNAKQLTKFGSLKGCITAGSDSPILESCKPIGGGSLRFTDVDRAEKSSKRSFSLSNRIYTKLAIFTNKQLLTTYPSTLGGAALALQYAKVIKMIEKLASPPYMIGLDIRDNLYNMLPSTLRGTLRARLKPYGKHVGSCIYDASLAAHWSQALGQILEWLAPLAHNTIQWHSLRSFEQQHVLPGPNVLLVLTLHFADRAKTESVILELLVGLNYLCRIRKE